MNTEKIIRALAALGLSCDETQAEIFCRFYELMVEKNKVMNLTRITDFDAYVTKHVVDSLSLCLLKQDYPEVIASLSDKTTTILDLGTGAGFPGVPLAVMYPGPHYTLMDSLNKRITFIEEAVAKCSITNIKALHGRAEEMGRDKRYREQFDLCTSRAVANLSTLTEYALPLIKPQGYFIAYKGGEAEEEIRAAEHAIAELGGTLLAAHPFALPQEEGAEALHRTLVLIQKKKPTPKKYPRQAGTAAKNPL